jgi:hemerythrin-like metal-binding protein
MLLNIAIGSVGQDSSQISKERLMAIEWNDKHHVDGSKIDAEHREWFRLANKFLHASDTKSRTEYGEAFIKHTRQHFFSEETLMRELHYPFTATHVNEHDALISTLTKVLDLAGESVLSKSELEDFVNYSLTKHIVTFDMPLGVYERRHCEVPIG